MSRFVLGGRIQVRQLASAPSSLNAPTQAELTAGVDMIGANTDEELQAIEGFVVESTNYPTPGFASLEVGNVPGPQTFPDSSLTWYKDDTVAVIYTAAAAATTGYLAIMFDGQASTEEVELYGFTISSRSRAKELEAAHAYTGNYAIQAPTYGTQAA